MLRAGQLLGLRQAVGCQQQAVAWQLYLSMVEFEESHGMP